MVQSSAGCWRTNCHDSSIVVTGAVDFHPGKTWTDTDGDLMQVSNPYKLTTCTCLLSADMPVSYVCNHLQR